MNRQQKGWIGEGAVYRHYAEMGLEVWNLAPSEPAADLFVYGKEGCSVYEVKYRTTVPVCKDGLLTEPRFAPDYKELLELRRAWCAERGHYYGLWIVTASKGPLLPAVHYKVLGTVDSPTRNGRALRVYEVGKHSLKRPENPHITSYGRLVPLAYSKPPPEAEL